MVSAEKEKFGPMQCNAMWMEIEKGMDLMASVCQISRHLDASSASSSANWDIGAAILQLISELYICCFGELKKSMT